MLRMAMKHSIEVIRSDFDKIALLSKDEIDYNSTYYGFLLKQIPLRCDTSLEIGCGTGAFSRLLAARSDQVVAIDLSPNMIQVARGRSQKYTNINFQTIDVMDADLPSESFDCIVSVATLHHLPIER